MDTYIDRYLTSGSLLGLYQRLLSFTDKNFVSCTPFCSSLFHLFLVLLASVLNISGFTEYPSHDFVTLPPALVMLLSVLLVWQHCGGSVELCLEPGHVSWNTDSTSCRLYDMASLGVRPHVSKAGL